jgi:hypothetical protein
VFASAKGGNVGKAGKKRCLTSSDVRVITHGKEGYIVLLCSCHVYLCSRLCCSLAGRRDVNQQ